MKKSYHHHVDHHLMERRQFPDRLPLPGTFLIFSIVGLFVSVIYTMSGRFNEWFVWSGGPTMGYTWGAAFIIVFLLMFISAVISITPRFERIDVPERPARRQARR